MNKTILLVDIEKRKDTSRKNVLKKRQGMIRTLREIMGKTIEVENYINVNSDYLEKLDPDGIILSGNSTPWDSYNRKSLEKFYLVLRKWDKPLLGICGGHQLLGMAFGARVYHMRKAREGEPSGKPGTWSEGLFIEKGWIPVKILKRDKLFQSLPTTIIVDEGHYDEVKEIPYGFELLATNKNCKIQAMKKTGKPIYGVQFHPHIFDGDHIHGKVILMNFSRIIEEY